jgi:hypothetical protein
MRRTPPEFLERYRITEGHYASELGNMFGAFIIHRSSGATLTVISSGEDFEHLWEHVSVSTEKRTPKWSEMCMIKDLFWDEEETVMQLHPPKSIYVNYHPFTLHLWKPMEHSIPLPPPLLVGPQSKK